MPVKRRTLGIKHNHNLHECVTKFDHTHLAQCSRTDNAASAQRVLAFVLLGYAEVELVEAYSPVTKAKHPAFHR